MAVKDRLFCSCKKSQKKKKKPLRMTAFYSLDVCDFARVEEREQGQRGAANVSSILDGNICYQLQLEITFRGQYKSSTTFLYLTYFLFIILLSGDF